MRRFFCACMDHKVGHMIQIDCFQKSKSPCRGGLPRPPAIADWLWICDEYETHPAAFHLPKAGTNHVYVLFWMADGLNFSFCPRMLNPPQMRNSPQFGILIISAVGTPLVTAKRRCKACVVFLCLDYSRSRSTQSAIDNYKSAVYVVVHPIGWTSLLESD
jgi:hypothetical protein